MPNKSAIYIYMWFCSKVSIIKYVCLHVVTMKQFPETFVRKNQIRVWKCLSDWTFCNTNRVGWKRYLLQLSSSLYVLYNIYFNMYFLCAIENIWKKNVFLRNYIFMKIETEFRYLFKYMLMYVIILKAHSKKKKIKLRTLGFSKKPTLYITTLYITHAYGWLRNLVCYEKSVDIFKLKCNC